MTEFIINKDGIDRKATSEEITEIKKIQSEFQIKFDEMQAEEKIKENKKAALLEKLGITEDEAKLLLS